ncbi:unnamed protein product, partial [marine sediment metagenome]
ELFVSGWSNGDASNYLNIFVPLAERHDGTSGSSGARIDGDSATQPVNISGGNDYLRIVGLRINNTSTAQRCIYGELETNDYVQIDSCLIDNTGTGQSIALQHTIVVETRTLIIKNNILYGDGTPSKGIYVRAWGAYGACTLDATLQNNTVNNCGVGIDMEENSQGVLNVTLENNICTNNTPDFDDSSYLSQGTISGNNNCSEDATGNDWDGSGSIISQTPSDLFVTEGSDLNLKTGSNAIDAGKTIAEFDNDALHLESDD